MFMLGLCYHCQGAVGCHLGPAWGLPCPPTCGSWLQGCHSCHDLSLTGSMMGSGRGRQHVCSEKRAGKKEGPLGRKKQDALTLESSEAEGTGV